MEKNSLSARTAQRPLQEQITRNYMSSRSIYLDHYFNAPSAQKHLQKEICSICTRKHIDIFPLHKLILFTFSRIIIQLRVETTLELEIVYYLN